MLLHQPELGQGHTSYSKKVGSGQLFQWVAKKMVIIYWQNHGPNQKPKQNHFTFINLDTKKEGVGESNVKLV